jgi:hypothetical protein
MSIVHHTPISANGTRLFYRSNYVVQKGKVGGTYKGPLYIPPKGNDEKGFFRLLDPENVIAQIRLYRWFSKRYKLMQKEGADHFSGFIVKDGLMGELFHDSPSINKIRIGRLLRMIVQYDVNFQRNASEKTGFRTLMMWRWSHYLDFIYGLEHLMLLWIPRVASETGGVCDTEDDFLEELEVIQGANEMEDLEYVNEIITMGLF